MSDTTNKTRTITLSDRPPVRIQEDNWPLLATAADKDYDNQYEFQANRISKWFLAVRQAADDYRTIVYATYTYTSNWQGARCYSAKHGVMIGTKEECETEDIVRTIREVCARMESCEHHGEDAARWSTLADECIADLPAEDLDADGDLPEPPEVNDKCRTCGKTLSTKEYTSHQTTCDECDKTPL